MAFRPPVLSGQEKENEMRNAVLVEKQRREQYQRMVPLDQVAWFFRSCSRQHRVGRLRGASPPNSTNKAEAVLFLQEEGRNYMARLDARRAAMKGKKGKKGHRTHFGVLCCPCMSCHEPFFY